jgi:PAS domain S-box-containing protein
MQLKRAEHGMVLAAAGSMALVFAFDLLGPQGTAVYVLYAMPVLLTCSSSRWLSARTVAGAGSTLILLGYFFSNPDAGSLEPVNRALVIVMLGVVALRHERRFRAEATSFHNAALLRQAQQMAHLGYWERDLDAGRITLSEEACRIFGLHPGAVSPELSHWHEQWRTLIHPEDRQRASDAFVRALDGGAGYDVEYRVIQPANGVRFVHSCAEVIRDTSGRPQRMFGTMQDITELRRAETRSRANETLLRTFVDHASDAFFMHSSEGNILDVNRHACQSLGYGREELIGKSPLLFDAGFSRTPAFAHEDVSARLDAGETLAFETLHQRKDGSLFPVEVRIRSFWADGHRYAVSLARDMTESKKAQASLRLFRSLIDHSVDGIEVIDPSTGRFLDVNEQACQTHGYTRDEYLALTVEDIAPGAAAQTWSRIVEDVRRSGSLVLEDRHRRKDGSSFPVEVNASYVRLDRDYLVAVVRDITVRKEVESALRRNREHLDALIRTIDGIVWEADPQALHFTYVSPRAERLLGYPLSMWLEEDGFWANHIHPDDRARAVRYCTNCVREKRDHELEYRMVAADGRSVWLRDLVNVVIENDDVVSLRGIMVDVTEQRRLEEQLRQSQKMEAIGQLAGGVAHDFNNILTAIIMEAEFAATPEGSPADVSDALRQIRAAAERAATLTRQLLMVSRRQVMALRLLDLNEVVTALANMLRRLMGEDICLTLSLHDAPLLVHADAGMLDQVILNLAVNARDALPQGGRVNIETGETTIDDGASTANPDATSGHHVWLSVSDTGCGIAPEVLQRIFEPFFTTKPPGRGTGLGLATVYGIIKQHRGWIEVETELGRGTTFRVFLAASEGESKVDEDTRPQPRGGRETILLVEDEEPVLRITRAVLERRGYEVLDATNGPQALEVFGKAPERAVSLLLTDLVMPGGMTGEQLAARLRERDPLLKVIYMSGYSPSMAGRELHLGPGSSFLQKPFSPEVLLETIRRTLDSTLA